MPNVLKKIPRGWELIPVGEEITPVSLVCCWPHDKWEPMGVRHCQPKVGVGDDSLPCGYYIRPKTKKRRGKK